MKKPTIAEAIQAIQDELETAERWLRNFEETAKANMTDWSEKPAYKEAKEYVLGLRFALKKIEECF